MVMQGFFYSSACLGLKRGAWMYARDSTAVGMIVSDAGFGGMAALVSLGD